jgi:hypothetical protein
MKTKVAILGAGCSCGYGYPLASEMKDHLEQFAKSIELSAPKLHGAARNTLAVFDKLTGVGSPAQTLDDLAWLVHQGKIATGPREFRDNYNDRIVDEAKAVVSAMFLAKEGESTARILSGYRNFLRRIFPDATHCSRALARSQWRILTFNIDRLFELAFRLHFDVDMIQTFYGPPVLNSGLFLVVPEQVHVETDRFSLLKLHGSAGFCPIEEYGHCNHYQMIPDPRQPVPISDETFFFADGHGLYSNRMRPSLIVFPHEKSYLSEYPTNTFPFRLYIPEIWGAARQFVANADEVWIIGYSLPEADWHSIEGLLTVVPKDCQIVIQNPLAETLAAKLRVRLPALAQRITACPVTFEV